MLIRALYGFAQQARKLQIAIANGRITLGTVGRGVQNTHTGTGGRGKLVPRPPIKATAAGNMERTHNRTYPMAGESANQDPRWHWARRPSRRRMERRRPHNMRPQKRRQTRQRDAESACRTHLPIQIQTGQGDVMFATTEKDTKRANPAEGESTCLEEAFDTTERPGRRAPVAADDVASNKARGSETNFWLRTSQLEWPRHACVFIF